MPKGIFQRPPRRPPIDRFWEKVLCETYERVPGLGSCWIWIGGILADGYGSFNDQKRDDPSKSKPYRAHRWIYEFLHGILPPDIFVLHRCDVPLCVRDEHHFTGPNAVNMRDMGDKGRSKFQKTKFVGEQHGMHKLTWEKVGALRQEWAATPVVQVRRPRGAGMAAELALKYGISRTTLYNIVNHKLWKEEVA